jgi:prepilin-type N-terminal cleavage/methylation domain-containing protein
MLTVRSQHRGGFTLIEILVMVIILGIASAIIVPQIGSHDDLKVAAAARLVMADLIYAQNRSISLQKMHYVQFDLTNKKYSLLSAVSPATIITHPVNKTTYTMTFGSGGSRGLGDVSLYSVNFDSQLTLAFDELGTPQAYNPSTGSTSELSNGSIVVKSGTVSLTIHVEPYTGEITVQ